MLLFWRFRLILSLMYVIMYVTINSQIMDSRTISISEARANIFKITKEVQKPDVYYVLTENGRSKAVVMSIDEFISWRETIEVMNEMPDLKKDIDEFEKDLKTGNYKNYITLEELLEKEGYEIQTKNKRKRSKAAK